MNVITFNKYLFVWCQSIYSYINSEIERKERYKNEPTWGHLSNTCYVQFKSRLEKLTNTHIHISSVLRIGSPIIIIPYVAYVCSRYAIKLCKCLLSLLFVVLHNEHLRLSSSSSFLLSNKVCVFECIHYFHY